MIPKRLKGRRTWLKVLPLYTPMTEPIISGTMIILRRCVRTGSGFSPPAASRLALRSFLIKASGLRLRPRWNLRRVCARVRRPCSNSPASYSQAGPPRPAAGSREPRACEQPGPFYSRQASADGLATYVGRTCSKHHAAAAALSTLRLSFGPSHTRPCAAAEQTDE